MDQTGHLTTAANVAHLRHLVRHVKIKVVVVDNNNSKESLIQ